MLCPTLCHQPGPFASPYRFSVFPLCCVCFRHEPPTLLTADCPDNTDKAGLCALTPRSLLPPVAMVTLAAATALVTYRQIVGERLHTNDGDVHQQRLFSPVVSCLPTLLDDEHLYAAFLLIWHQQFACTTVSSVRPFPLTERRARCKAPPAPRLFERL
jgi:hypothetical protein